MKLPGILLVMLMCTTISFAQRISDTDLRLLKKTEDTLKLRAQNIVRGKTVAERVTADSLYTRAFVRALKTKNSFYYPFDSVINISKLYAPDSSFRIFTWQLEINDNLVRQHGAIQMRTADGSFKRFPLIDRSDVTTNPQDTIAGNEGWMGAVYYKIIQNAHNGRTYYTLLGFDGNNIRSDKKVMDILEFADGKPVFGHKLFVMENSNVYQKNMARFIMEFKKDAASRLSYDKDADAVVFDELVSETGDPRKKWTLVPDGEYEGFRWKNGKWVHTANLFRGAPATKYSATETIRDAKGTIDDSKLKGAEKPEPVVP
ncbi:MAG: hypothetical protein WKF88_11280 [Ferruginibacter sp.]